MVIKYHSLLYPTLWYHVFFFNKLLLKGKGGWRDGLIVKNTGCSIKWPGFVFWHPRVVSQLSIISFRESDVFFQPLWVICTYMAHRHTFRKNTINGNHWIYSVEVQNMNTTPAIHEKDDLCLCPPIGKANETFQNQYDLMSKLMWVVKENVQ